MDLDSKILKASLGNGSMIHKKMTDSRNWFEVPRDSVIRVHEIMKCVHWKVPSEEVLIAQ